MPVTRERLDEIFAEDSKWNPSVMTVDPAMPGDLAAMSILYRLCPGKTDIIAAAEHDIVYFSRDIDKVCAAACEQDIVDLRDCGVFIQDDSFAMFC